MRRATSHTSMTMPSARAYLDDGVPLDRHHDRSDIDPDTLQRMIDDCAAFQKDNADDLANARSDDYNGHDFWLTRNRHGVGFWDRDLGEVGDRLTKAAHACGEVDLYVGDDGRIYA